MIMVEIEEFIKEAIRTRCELMEKTIVEMILSGISLNDISIHNSSDPFSQEIWVSGKPVFVFTGELADSCFEVSRKRIKCGR